MFEGKVVGVRYMVSYEDFPTKNDEYDLTKCADVLDTLGKRIASEVACGVYVWCDHPEYNDQKDFAVQFVETVPEDERVEIERQIFEAIQNEWLPEALDEAGVFEEDTA